MFFYPIYQRAGEHHLMLPGLSGMIEAVLTVPEQPINQQQPYFAILGHPHSLHGGSMNNKVVTVLTRVFKDLGIASLRFNFRGVGLSEGIYDAGIGESEDLLALKALWSKELGPAFRFIFAGFSFGSFVAYRAAAQAESAFLITVAPAVHNFDYHSFQEPPRPWLIVQGREDEVVDPKRVDDFAQSMQVPIEVMSFADTGHFFHGRLIELRDRLSSYLIKHLVFL